MTSSTFEGPMLGLSAGGPLGFSGSFFGGGAATGAAAAGSTAGAASAGAVSGSLSTVRSARIRAVTSAWSSVVVNSLSPRSSMTLRSRANALSAAYGLTPIGGTVEPDEHERAMQVAHLLGGIGHLLPLRHRDQEVD